MGFSNENLSIAINAADVSITLTRQGVVGTGAVSNKAYPFGRVIVGTVASVNIQPASATDGNVLVGSVASGNIVPRVPEISSVYYNSDTFSGNLIAPQPELTIEVASGILVSGNIPTELASIAGVMTSATDGVANITASLSTVQGSAVVGTVLNCEIDTNAKVLIECAAEELLQGSVDVPVARVSGTVLTDVTAYSVDAISSKATVSGTCISGTVASASVTTPRVRTDIGVYGSVVNNITVPAVSIAGVSSEEIVYTGTIVAPTPIVDGLIRTTLVSVAEDAEVWLCCKENNLNTTYSNFNFTSAAQGDGGVYASFSDGIYVIDNADDAGEYINAEVVWAETNLGDSRLKAVDNVFVNYRSDSDFQLVVKVDEQLERAYNKSADNTEFTIHTRRVAIPRGVRGKNWQVGFRNVDGGDFDLESLEVMPITLKRRIR